MGVMTDWVGDVDGVCEDVVGCVVVELDVDVDVGGCVVVIVVGGVVDAGGVVEAVVEGVGVVAVVGERVVVESVVVWVGVVVWWGVTVRVVGWVRAMTSVWPSGAFSFEWATANTR